MIREPKRLFGSSVDPIGMVIRRVIRKRFKDRDIRGKCIRAAMFYRFIVVDPIETIGLEHLFGSLSLTPKSERVNRRDSTRRQIMIYKLELPFPSRALHPNARTHVHTVTRAKRAARAAAGAVAAGIVSDPPAGSLALLLGFAPPDKRHRDIDGLVASCKAYVDGVFEWLGRDDREIRYVGSYWLPVDRDSPHVVASLHCVDSWLGAVTAVGLEHA